MQLDKVLFLSQLTAIAMITGELNTLFSIVFGALLFLSPNTSNKYKFIEHKFHITISIQESQTYLKALLFNNMYHTSLPTFNPLAVTGR